MARDKSGPNNLVAEWFGHRVFPTVASTPEALSDQVAHRCPFLSNAMESPRTCIKAQKSVGVCTISSTSNGPRQDWLVCPYRALDGAMVEDATRRMFSVDASRRTLITAATTLERPEVRAEILAATGRGDAVFTYMQDKLGGEISLSASLRSPELSFDVTIVELVPGDASPTVGRYGVLEVQTMDFHGSYAAVVKNLSGALHLFPTGFHEQVQSNTGWLSEKIEGPNVANAFKRTLYQMLFKFRLAGRGGCAGVVLAIPAAVWDSWQRHLGAPDLIALPDGTYHLTHLAEPPEMAPAWIYVFDLDAQTGQTPNPITLTKVIAADAEAIAHFAFKVAPDAVLAEGGSSSLVYEVIRTRLARWWPELGPPRTPRRARRPPVQ